MFMLPLYFDVAPHSFIVGGLKGCQPRGLIIQLRSLLANQLSDAFVLRARSSAARIVHRSAHRPHVSRNAPVAANFLKSWLSASNRIAQ